MEINSNILPEVVVLSRIYLIRGLKVMIDSDLAALYGVETRDLNKAVSRNIDRFPEDFMFKLSEEEFENLKFQIGTSSWGGRRKLPFAFTEPGVAMLSSVLRSKQAISVNIQIKEIEQDDQILLIFEYLRKLEKSKQHESDFQQRRQIGFRKSQ